MRTELGARGKVFHNLKKDELQKSLNGTLRGVTRVPSLLLTDPTQSLLSLHLEKYEVVASEPLHDIKGHLINLITKLPYILPQGDTANKCNHLIECCLSKEKKVRSRSQTGNYSNLFTVTESQLQFQNNPSPSHYDQDQ